MSEKNLVIVESPAKAKTIEKYLGKDFKVTSSFGHIRDLPKDKIGIDVKHNFKPSYEVSNDKKEVVSTLKKLVKECETVWLATDADREGEAISWHLVEALNLKDKPTKRIVFREITKKAILNAIQNPRTLDIDLVNAQQARRILDRLVGYKLSPVLWEKIKTGLSAGRVQSVAVRLIVEREREVNLFSSKSSFKITAKLGMGNGRLIDAELQKNLETEEEARAFVQNCMDANFTLKNLEQKPVKKYPAPPFTTSTLQQEAALKLGFSVAQTMLIAQKLYEAGKISYMRTDSTALSEDALGKAAVEIESSYGKEYINSKQFETKSETAQEAHEAIRPTEFSQRQITGNRNDQKLYELIWKRAIASQMADALLEKTVATIEISTQPQPLIATGEVIKFDGFLKVYIESQADDDPEEEDSKMLPPLTIGQSFNLNQMKALQKFSSPPSRYSEASLVRKLEELGIGRPSTYAPIISTIQKRDYVIKESREGKERFVKEILLKENQIQETMNKTVYGTEKNKLYPTNTALLVNDYLMEHFPNIMDFSFTAHVEKDFDEIARGKVEWHEMLKEFYNNFEKKLKSTENTQIKTGDYTREIGIDPKSGKKVYVRFAKFGPVAQIGENNDKEKPRFAGLKKGQLMDRITLEEAMHLFDLPRDVGFFENKPLVAAIGKFGPYIRHDNAFYSLGKEIDPLSITEEQAATVIINKRTAQLNKVIKAFDQDPNLKILNGRWGAYIQSGKENYKIPKDKVPALLSYEECTEIIGNSSTDKKSGRGRRRKQS